MDARVCALKPVHWSPKQSEYITDHPSPSRLTSRMHCLIFFDSLGLYLPPEYLLNLLLNKYIQPVRENFKLIVNKLLKNAFGGNYESWTFYLSNTSSIHPIPSTFKSMKQTKNFCYLFLSLAPTRLIDQFCSFFWCKMDQSILFQKN